MTDKIVHLADAHTQNVEESIDYFERFLNHVMVEATKDARRTGGITEALVLLTFGDGSTFGVTHLPDKRPPLSLIHI